MLNSLQKTATAVAHCKRGNGLLKVNGKPLEMLEPATLQYKVSSRLGRCSEPLNQLLCVIMGWNLCVPAAPGARVAAGEGALRWSWHQSQSEGWWTCRTSLRSEGNSRFPKDEIKPGVFNPMVLYFTAIRQAISKALVAYYQKCEYIHVPQTWCLIVCAIGDAFQTILCLHCSYLWCRLEIAVKSVYMERFKDVTLALVYDGSRLSGPSRDQTWMLDEAHDWCLRGYGQWHLQLGQRSCLHARNP